MALTPWEPFEGLTPLRDAMNRLLEESFIGPRGHGPFGRTFPLDVRETDTAYIVEAALPGIKPEQMQVTALDDTLTIRATATHEKQGEQAGTYVRQERYEGQVVRSVTLPGPINREQITAIYEHGVLTLQVPKAQEARGRTITIQVKEGEPPH